MRYLRFAIVLVGLTLGACSSTDGVEERRQFWQLQIDYLSATGVTLDQARTQLSSFDQFAMDDRAGFRVVDRVEVAGFVCSEWVFQVTVEASEDGLVKSASVDEAGVCL